MKFLENKNYYQEVKRCFESDEDLNIAVAFWGIDSVPLFTKNKPIKLICNLESTACNPAAIEQIQKVDNVEIKSNPKLHAKVLIQKSVAIIGSANISINGLAMESNEVTGWIESGLKTHDQEIISKSKEWFNKLWKLSNHITDSDIKKYKEKWKSRRRNRPIKQHKTSLIEAATNDIDAFKDREIYFVIYRDNNLSNDAQETFNEIKKDYTLKSNQLACYENWLELPDNAYVIDLYYGPKGGKAVYGIYEMPPDPIVGNFTYEEDGSKGNVKICFRRKNIYGCTISKKDKENIKNNIKNLWEYSRKRGFTSSEADSCIIPFVTGIKVINGNDI